MRPFRLPVQNLLAATLLLAAALPAAAQFDYERPPINYESATAHDRIAKLQQQIASGEAELAWDAKFGWLPATLDALDIPVSSQTLVFSKTSLQLQRISPERPRAIYFSDDVYVGWVQYGDVIEVSAVDPDLGAVFYTIRQSKRDQPEFLRDRGQCLSCHGAARTDNVPGFLVRSVFAGSDGRPYFRLGTTNTNHTTPFPERFGGWYVTGHHGEMRHRGNAIAEDDEQHPIDPETGANVQDLSAFFRTTDYLTPHSDLVALMVLEHQAKMHNLMTRASYVARQIQYQQQTMNKILERPADYLSESSVRRINAVSEQLLQYLLFCGEFALEAEVRGTSRFSEEFPGDAVRDQRGRSLRDLDLKTRLFRYPCSFLVYSDSFEALPTVVFDRLQRRLKEVLTAPAAPEGFEHLSNGDRQAVFEILSETHPRFRDSWRDD